MTTLVHALAALALAGAMACGTEGGTAPSGSFALAATPPLMTVRQGTSGMATIQIARTNLTSAVSLALMNSPPGITAHFAPQATSGERTVMTLNVAGSVSPGTYSLAIVGSAQGLAEQTASVTITVTPPPSGVSTFLVFVAAETDTVSASPGGSTSSTITTQRVDLVEDIALSVLSPRAGITGVFTPAVLTGSTSASTLQIDVDASVPVGTYTLTVQGTAAGATKTRAITLGVHGPSAFTLMATPSTVTAPQNTRKGVTIGINRTNFFGPVTLHLENAPVGMSTSFFLPNNTTASTVGLNLNVLETVPLGTYVVTVRGTAPGQVDKTVTIHVTVTLLSTWTIAAEPDRFWIHPGMSFTTTVSITRTNFTDDIALSVHEIDGITSSISPAVLRGAILTATATINVPPDWCCGGKSVIIRGTTDSDTRLTSVGLLITTNTIVLLSGTPLSRSIAQGSSGTFAINVTRVSLDGPVDLVVIGNPPGMSVSYSPAPVSGTTTTLTVDVGAGVPVGQYTLTVAAGTNPDDVFSAPVQFVVTVTAAAAPPH